MIAQQGWMTRCRRLESYEHYMIAAKSGYDNSLKAVGVGYKAGHVTKDEYAITPLMR